MADCNKIFFRSGDALRMDVAEKKAPVSEIAVVCGAERGVFELNKFGPGGASRCIRSNTQIQRHKYTNTNSQKHKYTNTG